MMVFRVPEAAMTGSSAVIIDIVSDVVCPWCFIGKRRLEAAIAASPGLAVKTHWRPFQLDGSIPPGGIARQTYLTRKFGGADKIAEIYGRIARTGREVGLAFDFDAITRAPNTLDAHRLIRWSAEADRQDAVVEALFQAYFMAGRDIGDPAVLADIAAGADLDRAEIAARLASETDKDAVLRDIRMAGQMGIQGVPFFILQGRFGLSGAQPVEVLREALEKAAAEAV